MWMAGGFQGRSWGHVEMLLPYSAIGIIGTILCARSLNALQLGDELAKSLGVRVMRMRTILIFLSALLAAVSVSVAGMLGFVGLIGTAHHAPVNRQRPRIPVALCGDCRRCGGNTG